MKIVGLLLISLISLQAHATKMLISCVNPATKSELYVYGKDSEKYSNLEMNPQLSNILMQQGIKNAYSFTGVGIANWQTLSFTETSPYGETLYLREKDGNHEFIFVSLTYKVVGYFLFNKGECKLEKR